MNKKHNIIIAGLAFYVLLLSVCFIYWPGLSGPLLLDDYLNLYVLHEFQGQSLSWDTVLELSPHATDRPISIISFIVNWTLTGGDIWFLKYTNLMLHLLCGCLVFWISILLFELSAIKNEHYYALWVSALWLLCPFLLTPVLYVIQRMTQLSSLFTLLGILSYLIGRINLQDKKWYAIYILFSIVCFWPLATLSKQTGIILPVLLLIIEYNFFQKDILNKNVVYIKNSLLILVSIIASITVYLIIFKFDSIFGGYSGRQFTLYERLISGPRILFDYVFNILLIPGASPMSLFHDDYIKSTSLFNPISTFISIVVWVGILITAGLNVGNRIGLMLFGLVFFFAAHLVESTFIPLELYFEHRNYLPAFGLFFSLAIIANSFLEKINYKKIALFLFLIPLVSYSLLTKNRASIWQSEESIYLLSGITHPHSPRVNEGLAMMYLKANKPIESIRYLERTYMKRRVVKKPAFYLKYLVAHCQARQDLSSGRYLWIEELTDLPNEFSVINNLELFVLNAELGKCDHLNLTRIHKIFIKAYDARNKSFDYQNNYSLLNLLKKLEIYIYKK